MDWLGYVTAGAAIVTAGATVVTAVVVWRQARHQLRVFPRVERGQDGALALYVELVNTGGVPVSVEQVFLSPRDDNPPSIADRLCDERGYPRLPLRIEPHRKATIGPVQAAAMQAVGKLKPITVVAKTEDRRVVQARCRGLRKLYQEADAAAGVGPQP